MTGAPHEPALRAEDQLGRREQPTDQWRRRAGRSLVVLLAVLSIFPRLLDLDAPLLERDSHRQTHNAIIVWYFVHEGISPLHYLTPIFGPPWQVPFEFPLFQMSAAGIVKLGVANVDAACRLTNIGYFYLSALAFYLLCRTMFPAHGVAACIVLFYLWCPFNISRSRTAMIDFASVAFALGYWLFYQRWSRGDAVACRPSLMVAHVFGVLGYLTKITTMPTVVIPLGYSIWCDLAERWRAARRSGSTAGEFLEAQRRRLLAIGSALAVPAAAGLLWAAHANAIANASAVTAGFGRNRAWLFGPFSERFDAEHWRPILRCLATDFFPGLLIVLPLAALWFNPRTARRSTEFMTSALLGALVTMLTFFNLYSQHDYYLMAVAPALCMLGGLGLYSFATRATRSGTAVGMALLLLCSVSLAIRLGSLVRNELTTDDDDQIVELGTFVRDHTRPDDYIVVTDFDWNPAILYYAQRKGLMIPGWMEANPARYAAATDLLRRYPFNTIVCTDVRPGLFSLWGHHEQIGAVGRFQVFRASHE